MKLKITLLLLCSFALTIPGWAQDGSQYGLPKAKDFNTWSVGVRAGLNIYQGDIGIDNGDFFENTDDFTYGLQVTKRVSHTIGIRARGMMGTFSGKKDVTDFRTMTAPPAVPITVPGTAEFESDMIEGSLNIVYNFGNISFLNRSKRFHLEVETGLGFFTYDSKFSFVNETNTIMASASGDDG